MAVDLVALHWHDWLSIKLAPQWPEHLTKARWERAKGVIAKATPTGVGAQMVKSQAAFDAVVKKLPRLQAKSLDTVGDEVARGQLFIDSSEMKKLQTELGKLRNTVHTAKNGFRRSKIPGLRGTLRLCEGVEADVDVLIAACSPNALRVLLHTFEREDAERIREKSRRYVGLTLENMRPVPARVAEDLDRARRVLEAMQARDARMRSHSTKTALMLDAEIRDLHPQIYDVLQKAARDITQSVSNLQKALEAGVRFTGCDPDTLKTLQALLVPYGHGEASKCNGASCDLMLRKIADVERGRKMFEPIAKDCQLG